MRKLIYSLTIVSLMLPSLIFAITISPNQGIIGSSNPDLVILFDYANATDSSLCFFNVDTGVILGGGCGLGGTLEGVGLTEGHIRVVGNTECFDGNVEPFLTDYCFYDYSFTPAGNYSAIELNSITTSCDSLTYTQCLGIVSFVSEALWFMRDSIMFSVPTSTVSSLTATITDAVADPGLLLVIVLAAGLPLAFWAIRRVIGLIPKGR